MGGHNSFVDHVDFDGNETFLTSFPSKLITLKLSSTNWQQWQRMVIVKLKGIRHYYHLVDDPPVPMTEDWDADDNLIMSAMWEAMEPDIQDITMQCSTAKEIWTLLQSTYSGLTSMAHAYSVQQAYCRCEMGSQSIEEYYSIFKKMCDQLEELFPLSTDIKTMQERQQQIHVLTFLGGLPKSYDAARTLVLGGPASISLLETYKLVREMYPCFPSFTTNYTTEDRSASASSLARFGNGGGQHGHGGGRTGGYGGHSASSSSSDNGAGSSLANTMCYYCKKLGHLKWNCPNKHFSGPQQLNTAHVASNSTSAQLNGNEIQLLLQYLASQHQPSSSATLTKSGELEQILAQMTGLSPDVQRSLFRGKEKDNEESLHRAGVQDMSKVVLFEDPASREQMKRDQGISEVCEAISIVKAEVDKLAQKVSALESTVHGGTKVEEKEFRILTELLMVQLLKLDGIEAEGEAKLQRRNEVRRIQSYVDTLDALSKNLKSIQQ